jgi:hypothetical protein
VLSDAARTRQRVRIFNRDRCCGADHGWVGRGAKLKGDGSMTSHIYSNEWAWLKCIEPVPRRKGNPWPEWQVHRFPIKGGISWRDVMLHHSVNMLDKILLDSRVVGTK